MLTKFGSRALPELERLLARYQRRFQFAALAAAIVVGAATGALIAVTLNVSGTLMSAQLPASVAAALVGAVLASIWWRRWTLARVAAAIERRATGLENLVVTAEEIVSGRRPPLHPILQTEVLRQ